MKNDAERLKDEIEQLGKLIDGLNDKRDKAKQQLADLECQFKVGDRVAYEKKSFEISKIEYSEYGDHRLHVKKIKKDGTPGLLEQRLYVRDKKKLVKL